MKISQPNPNDYAKIASYYSTPPVDANAALQQTLGTPPPAAPPAAAPPALPDVAQTLGVSQPAPPPPPKEQLPLGQALAYFAGIAPAPAGITGKAADESRSTNHAPYPLAPKPASVPTSSPLSFSRGPATSEDPAMAASEATQKTKPGEVDFAGAGRIMGDIRKAESAAKPIARAATGPGDYGAAGYRKKLYGTFDTEERALQDLATAERARSEALAAGMAEIGADKVREAAMREARAQHERDIQDAYMQDTQDQLDAVRSKTIDPNRLYRDGGAKALALIGGALGGLYQGLNHLSSNPFIDQMNRNIDRDIALQERELARQSKAVDDRRYILADMRNVYKDDDMARLQAKNLYYEGIKEQLQAQASTYDSPAIQARADQAINAVSRQQAALGLDEAAKRAARDAAAAAWANAERWKEREFALKQEEAITHRIAAEKSGAGHREGQSPNERFVATGRQGDTATGYLARNAVDAEKRQTARAAAQTLIKQIDHAIEIRNEQGALGRTFNRDTIGVSRDWQTKLRSLSPQMLINLKQSGGLGALDKGVQEIGADIIGDLESRGSSSEVRLKELRRSLEAALESEEANAGGQRARKLPGEQIEMEGGVNAPDNKRGTTGVDREEP